MDKSDRIDFALKVAGENWNHNSMGVVVECYKMEDVIDKIKDTSDKKEVDQLCEELHTRIHRLIWSGCPLDRKTNIHINQDGRLIDSNGNLVSARYST